ncbi:MAG: retroviral-like aspartic protease family protein, partial [Defluviitaleaceae bacterium]|nr:retroviral-like aspartic protease family protein [Defluviitaleaceae bacterium]
MKPVALDKRNMAYVEVHIAPLDGRKMATTPFLLDTGATWTSLPKKFLLDNLGYTEDYIQAHRILLPKESQPKMANGERADVYKIPITRINIGGHEI